MFRDLPPGSAASIHDGPGKTLLSRGSANSGCDIAYFNSDIQQCVHKSTSDLYTSGRCTASSNDRKDMCDMCTMHGGIFQRYEFH